MPRPRTKKAPPIPRHAPELAFGRHLRKLREEKGLSNFRLAVASGLSPDTIKRYQAGERSPTLTSLRKLVSALDLRSIVQLLPPEDRA